MRLYQRAAFGLTVVAAVGFAGGLLAQQSILDDPTRPAQERERDAGSKPLEVYAFFGVQSGMTVLDLMPGGGYNTVILSKVVGDQGTVYAGPDRRGRLAERLAAAPLANVTLIEGVDSIPADSLDVIVTVRNVHDLEARGTAAEAYVSYLAALKPGGIFGVVDARTPKEGFDSETHRINQQTVIDHVTAAGFELVETSEMLANPNDDFGMSESGGGRWSIDRMVLKFAKPAGHMH